MRVFLCLPRLLLIFLSKSIYYKAKAEVQTDKSRSNRSKNGLDQQVQG
jgi:hypothetical protein